MALQEENIHLRNLIDLEKTNSQSRPVTSSSLLEVPGSELHQESLNGAALTTPRLVDLPAQEAQQLLHSLLQENRALRKENADLYALREALLRQQEAVTKHNERLIKQIEGKQTTQQQRPATPYSGDYDNDIAGTISRSGASSPTMALKRSNSLSSISGRTVIVSNQSSQSKNLHKMPSAMGLNGTSILPVRGDAQRSLGSIT